MIDGVQTLVMDRVTVDDDGLEEIRLEGKAGQLSKESYGSVLCWKAPKATRQVVCAG